MPCDGCLHPCDLCGRDGTKCTDNIDPAGDDVVQIEEDGGIAKPATPMPWPWQKLACVQQHRDAAKEQRVDLALARARITHWL
eukprot:CAMPEP_0183344814 /NCGR_PEP_ID=MMETSP0164_2-20130417/10403_1 /TAXON_ID=221442 /ORGANISM="Coccolithus pelagicus ssp braarudi, Strain PLY182g" /LENGTH=82 /DNA_ID=CAMNT_0025515875 /DNA_START=500 /DNA_END=748 /DNA_ORIENTATION=-